MKRVFFIIIFIYFIFNSFSLFAEEDNWFGRNCNQRIYTGYYSSYFNDNIRLLQFGYDFVFKLFQFNNGYNLVDFSFGADFLLGFDSVNVSKTDNFGNVRPVNARITPGFELNWNARIYTPQLSKMKLRFYLEGLGVTLIVYSRPYPDNGTHVNIGSHAGLGFEVPVNNGKVFTTLRLFHSSNGKAYEHNPALNAVGIIFGVQF